MANNDARDFKMPLGASLVRALARLRDLHADMTITQIMALFMIAERPGITQRDLHVVLGTTDSASSRIVALLSEIGSRNLEGLHLVEMKVNVQDRRERHLYLTPKGRRICEDITNDIKRATY